MGDDVDTQEESPGSLGEVMGSGLDVTTGVTTGSGLDTTASGLSATGSGLDATSSGLAGATGSGLVVTTAISKAFEDVSRGETPVTLGTAIAPLSVPGGSWVGAVQGKKILKKYEVEVSMKDGIGSVLVPEEITKDVPPLWEDFLIGKFLETAPHIAKIHAIVNKIWALNDKSQKIEVYEVNSSTLKFRIPNLADRNRIIRRGMWNLAGIPVVVTKWSPVKEKEKPQAQSIPMWVHLKNVPLDMFSWQGLSFVSSPIGTPVRLHPETAQCLDLEVAKIFVRVDLTKDLPQKMNFNIKGKEFLVEYSYPWLPTKCYKCEKWGHAAKVCSSNKSKDVVVREEQEKNEKQGEDKEDQGFKEDVATTVESGLGSEQNQDSGEKSSDEVFSASSPISGTENQTSDPGKKEAQQSDMMRVTASVEGFVLDVDRVEAKEVEEKEWLDVSPGKSSRSPNTKNSELKFGQVAILTNSRFSVLSVEEEGEIVDDRGEEVEVHIAEVSLNAQGGTKEKEIIVPRQSLPRDSKIKHKVLGDKSVQKAQDASLSDLNKRKSRNH